MFKQLTAKLAAIVMIFAMTALGASAQNKAISGTVVDAAGVPVIGASVVVVGNTTNGAMTDLDGKFVLNVPANSTISVSCIGYSTQTIAVGNQTVFNITLAEDTEFLEETVVIGYGVQKKSDLTGAVGSVNSNSLKALSTTDAADALKGKVAGINILSNGAPGSGSEIRVRGVSSNGGNLSPLYIVDGLQVSSIQYLDPSMIESMEILKDAASAAIYGAQAGNGVVLVTTKQGTDGTASLTYSAKFTNQNYHRRPLMNRAELIDYLGLEYGKDWVDARLADFDYKHPMYENGVIDTDWIGAYLESTWSQQHSISLSGGNKSGHYFLSLNNVNENGVVKGDRDVYKRLTAQFNADYQFFKWLQVGTTTSIEKWDTKSVSQRGYSSSFESLINYDPMTPVYWTDPSQMGTDARGIYDKVMAGDPSTRPYRFIGDENGLYAITRYSDVEGNPLAKIYTSDGTNGGFNINGTGYANITPIKGLTITSRLGYRITQSSSHEYRSPYYIGRGSNDNYRISAGVNTGWYYQWENFANYMKNFGKHSITAMAGMSYRENNSDNASISAENLDILSSYGPAFQYINYLKSDVSKSVSNAPGQSNSLAYFGRLIYSYDNRYSLQANFRADAFDSSKLSKENRWGYFPSFSAGWTISNEKFFKDNIDTNAFNFLKLRASWGRNGNVNVLSGYRYATTISSGNNWYQYHVDQIGSEYSSAPNYGNGLPNPNLKWETSEQVDLGLDARFLNNRLTFGADFFNKKTRDLLFNIEVPVELGASRTTVNGGVVLNRGFEFELGWKDNIGDFSYSINANFSTLKNEVLELASRATRSVASDASSTNYKIQTAFEPGYPVWYLLGFNYEGVDANGNAIYTDNSGDGEISTDDMQYIGTVTPTYTMGLNINLAYKGFDFTLNGNGQGGNYVVPVTHRTGVKNNLKYYYENADKLPKASSILAADNPFWSSTGNCFRADFFRIGTLQLGYTIPAAITKKAAISNFRVYASLDDFFTITKYPGLDPATATNGGSTGGGLDWGSYPTMQKIILGINLTF